MKFVYRFKIKGDFSPEKISELLETQLERRNFKLEKHYNGKVHFFIVYPYMAFHWKNKNYNYFLRDGLFQINKEGDVVHIAWSISNKYLVFFSVAIFMALMSVGLINSVPGCFLLIAVFVLTIFFFFVRLNVKAWLNKIVKSCFGLGP